MEKLQFFEGVATFFYGVALVCFGGLIFLLFRHQRGREEWMQRMQQHQSYPANSIELQSLGEAPRRQEPHGNLSGDRVLWYSSILLWKSWLMLQGNWIKIITPYQFQMYSHILSIDWNDHSNSALHPWQAPSPMGWISIIL
jgi:hypothetical protein